MRRKDKWQWYIPIKSIIMMYLSTELMSGALTSEKPPTDAPSIEYREGNFAVNTVGKQPGLIKYENITLKWGMTDSMELYNWMKEVEGGTINRKTVVISLHDDTQKEIAKWTVISAWPTKYTATDFNATSNEAAVETLVLAHEGVTRDK